MLVTGEALGSFVTASVLLALAPGPDNVFVLTQSALHGARAGWLVTLGLTSGLIVHTCAVAFGVAALLAASPLAFTVLKVLGATYLAYLAWQVLRAPAGAPRSGDAPRLAGWALYRRGILMNVSNPKVTVFFLAFLPQFADPARGALTAQILLLGAAFMLVTVVVFGAVAGSSARLGAWLSRRAGVRLWMNRITGIVFIALALRLLLTEL